MWPDNHQSTTLIEKLQDDDIAGNGEQILMESFPYSYFSLSVWKPGGKKCGWQIPRMMHTLLSPWRIGTCQ